jgi:hypothetical protein
LITLLARFVCILSPDTNSQKTGPIEVILPTYIMKPSQDEKFYPSKVKEVAEQVLKEEIDGANIDESFMKEWAENSEEMEALTKDIADRIKIQCRTSLKMPRYKLIVQVTIGQNKDQGVHIASRCLWDTSTDNYASCQYKNSHIWASAIVFGMYTE